MQALFTGVVTAATAWWRGSTPLWVPLAAALTAGALVASRSYENWDTAFIVLAVHAASAWACWALVCRRPGWNDDASLSGS